MKGLEENTSLISLFIQENIIEDMSEGLAYLCNLRTLNLSDNMIKTVSGLGGCTKLDTLYLKRNRIGCGLSCIDDLKGLIECPSLHSVDVSDNNITDPAVVDEIFLKMPNLLVLYCQ